MPSFQEEIRRYLGTRRGIKVWDLAWPVGVVVALTTPYVKIEIWFFLFLVEVVVASTTTTGGIGI